MLVISLCGIAQQNVNIPNRVPMCFLCWHLPSRHNAHVTACYTDATDTADARAASEDQGQCAVADDVTVNPGVSVSESVDEAATGVSVATQNTGAHCLLSLPLLHVCHTS